jgi:hypothetical protein
MDGRIVIKTEDGVFQRRPERKPGKPGELILKDGRSESLNNGEVIYQKWIGRTL